MSENTGDSGKPKPFQVIDTDENETKKLHPLVAAIQKDEDDVQAVQKELDEARMADKSSDPLKLSDNSGMTPLMHAAWKGKAKTVKFLLDQGADPNFGKHEHDYSPLHFAALAGKEDVCRILLEFGANPDAENSVKRTPSQMAGFVGNSGCVAIINNFVPKESVYYFTRKQPLEDEPKLPINLAKPIHNLVMTMNISPIRVALILKDNEILLSNLGKVCQILELMSEREFKNRKDVNEVLSLKYHMLHYIIKDIWKQQQKDQESSSEKKTPFIDRWIKSMLFGRDSDGFPAFQENFLRQGVKEFPFKESTLFKVLVTNFSQNKDPGICASTAAEVINQTLNGQKGFKDDPDCFTCANEKAEKKCSNCKAVQYCDQKCQKLHWFVHKKFCSMHKEQFMKAQKMSDEAQSQHSKQETEKNENITEP